MSTTYPVSNVLSAHGFNNSDVNANAIKVIRTLIQSGCYPMATYYFKLLLVIHQMINWRLS